jgi:hypothetical protein
LMTRTISKSADKRSEGNYERPEPKWTPGSKN